ncbi:MAG TPA: putative toxin-antitoxin system toxin component, PIN family, partial [Nitrospiraceae bacterium]|nr:putative toxin-antitoxin system toxin component, PIN family [Nitrospiraceae bacterium]
FISRAGVCASLLEDILMDHEWVISSFILEEVVRKLEQKFGFPENEVAQIRAFIVSAAQIVEPAEIPPDSCRDPNDLPVLGTAVAGGVDVLITVDKDLLEISTYEKISIVKPGEFWKRVEHPVGAP